MKNTNISSISRLLLIISSIMLVCSIFLPIWRIELSAPQYPEGLVMLIYSNALGGNVDIINGLNHYIGMQTLHADNFIEFTILPYIISFFVGFAFIAALIGKRRLLNYLFIAFVIFGIIAMIDFWRWEYNYGHNLDPNAAIQVPGMSYQPPLIGYKVLLNFGAYSIPDVGGWLFIGSGFLMFITVFLENNLMKLFKKKSVSVIHLLFIQFLSSCGNGSSEPIQLNSDACEFCKMTISDGRFGAELITDKGRVYKFDDIGCLIRYKTTNLNTIGKSFYVHDFSSVNTLIPAESAYYISSDKLNSPMGGNYAAFVTKDAAELMNRSIQGEISDWTTIQK